MAKPDDELMALGKAIRELRIERGISTDALAKRLGLGSDKLENLERGESEATFLELAHIAKALGVTTEALCARAGL